MALLAMAVMWAGNLLVWQGVRRLARHQVNTCLVALLAVSIIVGSLLDERRAWVLRLLAWEDWVYFARLPLWLGIMLLLSLAWWAAAGLKRRAIGVLLSLVVLYATLEVASPACLPMMSGQLSAETEGTGQFATEVQQSTGWSCGPAALAWALRLRGLPASEREIALLSATVPLQGTSWAGMYRAARHHGLSADVSYPATWEQLIQAPKPLLADWRLNAVISHMVVVIATTPDTVTVGDPLCGEQTYSKVEFLARWEKGMMTLTTP